MATKSKKRIRKLSPEQYTIWLRHQELAKEISELDRETRALRKEKDGLKLTMLEDLFKGDEELKTPNGRKLVVTTTNVTPKPYSYQVIKEV